MKSDPGKLSKNWLSFYSFIRRAGKFIAQMKNNKLRFEFEKFLTTVGRDPRTYQDEVRDFNLSDSSIFDYVN